MLTLNRSEHPFSLFPIVERNDNRFQLEKAVCDQVNAMDPTKKKDIFAKCKPYFDQLSKLGITDEALMNPHWGSWWRLLLFVLAFIPFVIGRLFSYPIILVARRVTAKTAKKVEFRSSVHMGVAHLFAMAYYLVLILISLLTWNIWWVLFALALPTLGWFGMFYRENWLRWTTARRAQVLQEKDQLLETRRGLLS